MKKKHKCMSPWRRLRGGVAVGFACALVGVCVPGSAEERLIVWNKLRSGRINAAPAEMTVVDDLGGSALALRGEGPATVVVLAPRSGWNLLSCRRLGAFLKNTGGAALTVEVRWADGTGREGLPSRLALAAGAASQLVAPLPAEEPRLTRPLPFVGMNGAPVGFADLELAKIMRMLIAIAPPDGEASWQLHLGDVWADGKVAVYDAASFLPFVDEFGQFIHRDWPGKIHGEEDFSRVAEAEREDLAGHPRPADWNPFGGWAEGPRHEATGHFRTERGDDGRWWLIDPLGQRFWSWGVNCLQLTRDHTPVSGREGYFRWLPEPGSPFAEFYGESAWAPVGWYRDKGPYRSYGFAAANLLRKHGGQWPTAAARDIRQRLPSWGLNTVGNWSDLALVRGAGIPYCVTVHYAAPEIAASKGHWGRFPDVFDPLFRRQVRAALKQTVGPQADDPHCLGVFVDNELDWGDETALALATLASPESQAAKGALVAALQDRYDGIDALNAAWGTRHRSWTGMRNSQRLPEPLTDQARSDLAGFTEQLAETYFRTVHEELREIAPGILYLGCRFAWRNDLAVRAAARHCDVLSFNLYEDSATDFTLPPGVDMPVLIGEFHFGAIDRGLFHSGLRPARSQEHRAEKLRRYLRSALGHRNIVGAHWFQYRDQPLTGRGDGENYQVGLVDVTDHPYAETIAATREIGAQLYRLRAKR
jgi:hypothetical protein